MKITKTDVAEFVVAGLRYDENIYIDEFLYSVEGIVGFIHDHTMYIEKFTLIKESISLIEKKYHINLDINNIPIDDEKTYAFLRQRKPTNELEDRLSKLQPATFTDLYLVNKYPDNPLLKQTENGYSTYMHRPKVFRIAEIYLIAAEAAYKNGDQTNAKTYLDRLRTARGIGSVTYTDLWAEIQNERNRELAFEGFRMADIKRWNLGVVRGTPQNLSAIVSDPADQYYQLNIPAGNYKMVWPLSPSDILYEQGKANWQQNPGW